MLSVFDDEDGGIICFVSHVSAHGQGSREGFIIFCFLIYFMDGWFLPQFFHTCVYETCIFMQTEACDKFLAKIPSQGCTMKLLERNNF